jgi:predicted ATP-grasp superfamily ATP-dependent carboligase
VATVDTSAPAVVLKLHRGSLGAVRSLGQLGVDVYGVDAGPDRPAARSRHLRGLVEWDVEGAPPEASVDRLLDLGRTFRRPAVLIPTSDRTSLFVAEHGGRLAARYLFPRLEPGQVRVLIDKWAMGQLASRMGIDTPAGVRPESTDELLAFARRARYPLVVKGVAGPLPTVDGGPPMAAARDEEALLAHFRRSFRAGQRNVLVQELPPRGTSWIVNGYFAADGACVCVATGRKLRQYPNLVGPATFALVEDQAQIRELSVEFLRRLCYRGPFDLDWFVAEDSGAPRLLDVNPRIGAAFRLFAGAHGLDIVRLLYLDLTGQELPVLTPPPGRKWLVEDADLRALAGYRRERSLGVLAWLRSIAGVDETAWLAADDPRPALAAGGAFLLDLGRWLHRRRHG